MKGRATAYTQAKTGLLKRPSSWAFGDRLLQLDLRPDLEYSLAWSLLMRLRQLHYHKQESVRSVPDFPTKFAKSVEELCCLDPITAVLGSSPGICPLHWSQGGGTTLDLYGHLNGWVNYQFPKQTVTGGACGWGSLHSTAQLEVLAGGQDYSESLG